MPATLAELEAGLEDLPAGVFRDILLRCRDGGERLPLLIGWTRDYLGGYTWQWPLLDDWARWAGRRGVTFALWSPVRELDEGVRAAVLVHTLLALVERERQLARAREVGGHLVTSLAVVGAGDDRGCALCAPRAGTRIAWPPDDPARLPPFHPACRCGIDVGQG
jgi:hypothetical protein